MTSTFATAISKSSNIVFSIKIRPKNLPLKNQELKLKSLNSK
jgi:hypothetical protein